MRKNVLDYENEPTDEELSELMKEVATDAKESAFKIEAKIKEKFLEDFEISMKNFELTLK
jgi:hypothetical protein